jgi:hypothetical protein
MMWTGGVMNSITVITDGIARIAGMRAGKFLTKNLSRAIAYCFFP